MSDRRWAAGDGVEAPHVGGYVPLRALVLSGAALSLPLGAQWLTPGIAMDELGVLLWLPSLVPAFLLTYYRGWHGASLAIASGMAVLTLIQVAIAARRSLPPDWRLLMGLVVVLVAVSLGAGWLGERLRHARHVGEELALLDPVTGMSNRRHLGPYLDAAYAAAARGGALTVILCDVDGFRWLVEAEGRRAGERVLRVVGRLLTEHTRRVDLSAHAGNDEFVTVMPARSPADAMRFIDQVRAALAQERFPWGDVTVSAGVAAHGRGVVSPDVLLAEADRALHRAHESGADQVVVWRAGAQGRAAAPIDGVESVGAAVTLGAAEPPADAAHGRARVLVVAAEDDASPTTEQIARLGFQPQRAGGPEDVLERLAGPGADIVVADVRMTGMGGFTLADRIATEHPGVPVLLASRYAHDALSTERRPASVVAFLTKPIELRELGTALEQALARAKGPA